MDDEVIRRMVGKFDTLRARVPVLRSSNRIERLAITLDSIARSNCAHSYWIGQAADDLRLLANRARMAAPAMREATMMGKQLAWFVGFERERFERELSAARDMTKAVEEMTAAELALSKETALRDAALELLRDMAELKRYDPNEKRTGYPGNKVTINIPRDMIDRMDMLLESAAVQAPIREHDIEAPEDA